MDITRKHYALYVFNKKTGRYGRVGQWLVRKSAQRHYNAFYANRPYPDCLHAIVLALPMHEPINMRSNELLNLMNGATWLVPREEQAP